MQIIVQTNYDLIAYNVTDNDFKSHFNILNINDLNMVGILVLILMERN